MNSIDRKKYWNEDYFRYWKSRVDESNIDQNKASGLNAHDSMTATDEAYIDALRLLGLRRDLRTLEVGCGFGRSLPFLCDHSETVDAIDISEAMIREARALTTPLKNLSLHISEAEKMPFENGSFDRLVCFSVFDALDQQPSLLEFNRVCKVGARAIVTGKNDDYFDDDEKAFIAEVRAREKGHPNSFTDLRVLLNQISSFGFRCLETRYFLRRGDTATNSYTVTTPDHFYEYTLLLEKTAEPKNPPVISSGYSKTFYRLKQS